MPGWQANGQEGAAGPRVVQAWILCPAIPAMPSAPLICLQDMPVVSDDNLWTVQICLGTFAGMQPLCYV